MPQTIAQLDERLTALRWQPGAVSFGAQAWVRPTESGRAEINVRRTDRGITGAFTLIETHPGIPEDDEDPWDEDIVVLDLAPTDAGGGIRIYRSEDEVATLLARYAELLAAIPEEV